MDCTKNKKNDLKKSFINLVAKGKITRIIVTNQWATIRLIPIKKL